MFDFFFLFFFSQHCQISEILVLSPPTQYCGADGCESCNIAAGSNPVTHSTLLRRLTHGYIIGWIIPTRVCRMFWGIRLKWLVLCFHRWQPERRWEWGDGHRRCLALAASARADSPPSGASTLPQRKKQKLILVSTRSECCFHFQSDLQNSLAAKISFFFSLPDIDCVQFFWPLGFLSLCATRSLLMEKSQWKGL